MASRADYDERRRERFWGKVDVRGLDECWPWIGGGCGVGYGGFAWDARRGREVRMPAHRASYIIHFGHPGDLHVDHLCCNRRCVNPAHLEAVDMSENTRRAVERRTHCRNGHEISAENTRYATRKYGDGTRIVRECRKCDIALYHARKAAG